MLYFSITDLHYFTICLPMIMVPVSDTSTNFKCKTFAKKNKTFRKWLFSRRILNWPNQILSCCCDRVKARLKFYHYLIETDLSSRRIDLYDFSDKQVRAFLHCRWMSSVRRCQSCSKLFKCCFIDCFSPAADETTKVKNGMEM